MDSTRQAPERLLGYDVVDGDGTTIGPAENIWVDGATDQLEFVAVQAGAGAGRTHIVPLAEAQIDDANRRVRVPYRQDQIAGAPHVAHDAELSDEDEDRVYSYYGIARSTAPSPTGLPGGAGAVRERPQESTTTDRVEDRRTVELREEELRVRKEFVQTGEIVIRKEVVTETRTIEVPVRREHVVIERRGPVRQPAEQPVGEGAEEVVRIPVLEEEVTIVKRPVVTEEVIVGKRRVQDTERVSGEVRREEARIEREGAVTVRDSRMNQHPSDREAQQR